VPVHLESRLDIRFELLQMRQDAARCDSAELAVDAVKISEHAKARCECKYTNRIQDLRHRLSQLQLAAEPVFSAFHLAVVGFMVITH